MEYKMRDVVRITGLPRTTIQGYFKDKKTKSLTSQGGGGPQWKFSDEELEDLWLIKICLGIGKSKKEIEILRSLPTEEKRNQLKTMLDTLQDYIRMANMYVEARPIVVQLLNKEGLSLEVSKLFADLWTKVSFITEEDEDIFEQELSEDEWEEIFDLLDDVCSLMGKTSVSDKVLQNKITKIDKILNNMIEVQAVRKYLLDYLISEDEDVSKLEKDFLLEAFSQYYGHTEDFVELGTKLMEPIYENCDKAGYTSSLIQEYINDIYLFYKQCAYNKKTIFKIMEVIMNFYGSKENIKKYENGIEKGYMWYLSKAIETYMNNNKEKEDK